MTYNVKNISISIDRNVTEVTSFVSDPTKFPQWIAFIRNMQRQADLWKATTDNGELIMKFVSANDLGVVDHTVTMPDGSMIHNVLRVIANGSGSEVIFTLFHLPQRSEAEFNTDASMVEKDLQKLKDILES